ncbi:adenylate/guanylate cyclase domain-containing protein [Aegicerativicinus sediminis]|uniref:adenylate/guanylate cyclase domain-containing protein n=1 Tax=Aegicerativicinus sediminis TaxID=2893202 RepID=UPI001E655A25|nr:adenylate/guanylate cyclase domain-containing protein [Aegicerativicinus sediminis]
MDKRKLAAIMFTDIVGYTALMQQDEQLAIKIRNRHRETFERTLEAFNGTMIQYYGDGTLSIFESAVEAVECAIELQKAYIAEPKIPIRIGIHVGDIIQTSHDIIGDAVNVTSRIESAGIAGSILISDKIRDQLRGHQHIKVKFLDAYDFKNVDTAIPLYAIANKGLEVPEADEVRGKLKQLPEIVRTQKKSRLGLFLSSLVLVVATAIIMYFLIRPSESEIKDRSIAVLPFSNLSTDEDSDIFREGVTEEILTHLSRYKDLHVISRTSVSQYENTQKTITDIAKELGVAYIVEGSIRKYGDKIRITAQLIDAQTDEHVWSENYDKTLTDIFEIQSEVAKEIAEALQVNINLDSETNTFVIPTISMEAYQYFLRGRQEADKRNEESIKRSIEFFKKAIEIDPQYAEAYAEIANSTFLQAYYGQFEPDSLAKVAIDFVSKAELINPNIARIYSVKGMLYNHSKEFELAKTAFEKAIELSPNDVTARRNYATYFYYTNQFEKQLNQSKIAYQLDPLSFASASNYFSALTFNEKWTEAEQLIETIEKDFNDMEPFIINRLKMRLYMASGDYNKVIKPLEALSANDPNYYRMLGYSAAKIGDKAYAYRVIDTIRKREDYELKSHHIAVVFAGLKEKDSVFYYLNPIRNKSIQFNSSRLSYFDEYKNTKEYEELLKAHGID